MLPHLTPLREVKGQRSQRWWGGRLEWRWGWGFGRGRGAHRHNPAWYVSRRPVAVSVGWRHKHGDMTRAITHLHDISVLRLPAESEKQRCIRTFTISFKLFMYQFLNCTHYQRCIPTVNIYIYYLSTLHIDTSAECNILY